MQTQEGHIYMYLYVFLDVIKALLSDDEFMSLLYPFQQML